MKPGTIALSVFLMVMSINPSIAGRRHGQHHQSHYRGHGHHYNHHKSYGHNYYGRRGYYNHYGRGHYATYALGGLIVGGILGATSSYLINNNQSRYSRYREPVYVAQAPVNQTTRPTYIIQPDGSCYVISHVSNGSLVLAPVALGRCE